MGKGDGHQRPVNYITDRSSNTHSVTVTIYNKDLLETVGTFSCLDDKAEICNTSVRRLHKALLNRYNLAN